MTEEFLKVILYLPDYLTELFYIIGMPGNIFEGERASSEEMKKNSIRFNYITMGLSSLFLISLIPDTVSIFSAILLCLLFFVIQAAIDAVFTFLIMRTIFTGLSIKIFITVKSFYNGTASVLVVLLAMISLGIFKYLEPLGYSELFDSLFFNNKTTNLAYCNAFEISSFIFAGGLAFIIIWSKLAWETCRGKCGIKKTAFGNILAAWNVFFIPLSLLIFFLIVSLMV